MRVNGSQGVKPIECINPPKNKWAVRWDIQPSDESGCDYEEQIFDHKPTLGEIKDLILGWSNKKTETKIIEGFAWNGIPVWLSIENQVNIQAAYNLAVQSEGKNLPTMKLGTSDEPVYHTFQSMEEFADFYTKSLAHVQNVRAEGWKEKDSFDFDSYENS